MSMPSAIGDVTYTQFNQLSHVIDSSNDPAALKKAAQHFESLFIDMWLKSAREANRVLSEDNPMRTPELEMHEEMRDHEFAVHLSKNGGIGLAEVIIKQLQGLPDTGTGSTTPASTGAETIARPQTTQSAAGGLGRRAQAFSSAESFVENILPLIDKVMAEEDIPAMGVLSQAALETGWGQRVITDAEGNLSHNLFGVKSESLQEPSVRVVSQEYAERGWSAEEARFRSYPDWEASLQHYLEKLKNSSRYADVMHAGPDVRAFAERLTSAGYATDPDYADKIVNIYERLQHLVNG